MEVALHYHGYFLFGISPNTAPLPSHHFLPRRLDPRSPIHNHAPTQNVSLVMKNLSRRSSLAFRLLSSANKINNNNNRFEGPKLLSFMASNKNNNNNLPQESATEKMKKEEEKKLALPPPPEKPEPGDCCGSGCVRCVWDVYYEELEAYNNLCNTDSNTTKSKPS